MKNNIILIMADQFRADCVGYDGNSAIMTPHLDDLAENGCFFKWKCQEMCSRETPKI